MYYHVIYNFPKQVVHQKASIPFFGHNLAAQPRLSLKDQMWGASWDTLIPGDERRGHMFYTLLHGNVLVKLLWMAVTSRFVWPHFLRLSDNSQRNSGEKCCPDGRWMLVKPCLLHLPTILVWSTSTFSSRTDRLPLFKGMVWVGCIMVYIVSCAFEFNHHLSCLYLLY